MHDQRSTITIKRPICYKKQRKYCPLSSCYHHRLLTYSYGSFFRQSVTYFALFALFFSLYGEYDVVRTFPPSGWCFFYLVLGGLDFSLQSIRYILVFPPALTRGCSEGLDAFIFFFKHGITSYKNCLQPYGLRPDRFQTIIGRTSSRRTEIFGKKYLLIYALSGRHCGPHSSSIKQLILNWHDRLLKIG